MRASLGNATGGASGDAGVLCLAATPTFAIIAVFTIVLGGGKPDSLCSAAHDASPLNPMVLMYLLMSAFHSSPWLRLLSQRHVTAEGDDALP